MRMPQLRCSTLSSFALGLTAKRVIRTRSSEPHTSTETASIKTATLTCVQSVPTAAEKACSARPCAALASMRHSHTSAWHGLSVCNELELKNTRLLLRCVNLETLFAQLACAARISNGKPYQQHQVTQRPGYTVEICQESPCLAEHDTTNFRALTTAMPLCPNVPPDVFDPRAGSRSCRSDKHVKGRSLKATRRTNKSDFIKSFSRNLYSCSAD